MKLPKMHTVLLFRDKLYTSHIQLIHRINSSNLMKLSSLCRDTNYNVRYRQKSPERTISISVTLKLLQCVWCNTGKNY